MANELDRGRTAYREQAWDEAFAALDRAAAVEPLGADDLERLARSAYMLGRDEEYAAGLERAHQAHLEAGATARAVRCAFWVGHSFLFRGERVRASGWFARAERLLDDLGSECVERGYLLIPVWLEAMARGDFETGEATTAEGIACGERFGDPDLTWMARSERARALLRLGRVEEGRRLVDEALIAATSGELTPIVTGIVFCNTIAFCRACHELRHVREWTHALTQWCERQPQMVAHNGLCLVHRAQVMLLEGQLGGALAEARTCAERFGKGVLNQLARGESFYCQGECHRLAGDFVAAEDAYRRASEHGREPQPGLSLLRLEQGKGEAAAAAMRRAMTEKTLPLARAWLLPAYVDVMLAVGEPVAAAEACRELQEIATAFQCESLEAAACHARGALALAEGRASDALKELQRALGTWKELAAPHEVARVRVRIGLACRALGDEDTAELELDAARRGFEALGAVLDRARADELLRSAKPAPAHGLTAREIEVLREVAQGKTNREIAHRLHISEFTVARHVQNIFAKLEVTTRAAATAFAFGQKLV